LGDINAATQHFAVCALAAGRESSAVPVSWMTDFYCRGPPGGPDWPYAVRDCKSSGVKTRRRDIWRLAY